jgi:hypothetical protein
MFKFDVHSNDMQKYRLDYKKQIFYARKSIGGFKYGLK